MTFSTDRTTSTTTPGHVEGDPGRRSARADRIAAGVAWTNAVLTLVALGYGIYRLTQVPDDELVVQGWRTFGFLVFFSLWVMVAVWPRRTPGAWELIFVHKVAITVFALTLGGAPEARETALIDGWLVLSGAVAYVLARGWTAWRPLLAGRPAGQGPVRS
ncbi:hypothetical protein TEK04_02025 [Klenkia sp. LSe6-5]|uniref:Uncharacterized protein n=1 Tax=Klenkia sesuvii TaxID=3103137 RepID=A0ABU8DNV2_9ACTN